MLSTKQVLLHRLTQERATLLHSIEFLPEEELTRRPVIGEWSVKDILGHIASWEEEYVRSIRQFARGERPHRLDIEDVDAWNAEEARRKWDWPLTQIMDDLRATRRRLLDLLSGLPDDVFGRPAPPPYEGMAFVQRAVNGLADHDRAHWDDLMRHRTQWIARQTQTGA